jgi:putative flippase GtrA
MMKETQAVQRHPSELFRFFLVALFGLGLDLAIAWTMAEIFGISLGLAAMVGFVVTAMFNYVVHELWTFQHGARQLSLMRVARYTIVQSLTLMVRLLAIAFLVSMSWTEGWTLLVLAFAAGVSFVANYAASKFIVFGPAEIQAKE